MSSQIITLSRFPVKSLSEEKLSQVTIRAGELFPEDRRYALAFLPDDSPSALPWQPKRHFTTLVKDHRLCTVNSRYDAQTQKLILTHPEQGQVEGQLTNDSDRQTLEQFLTQVLGTEDHGTDDSKKLRLVDSADQGFTDRADPHISLINRKSVADLSEKIGHDITPERFRGNILIDGLAPWEERGWIGQVITIGTVRFAVERMIGRCKATAINLETKTPDHNIPKALKDHYGHTEMGLYLRALGDGILETGQAVQLEQG